MLRIHLAGTTAAALIASALAAVPAQAQQPAPPPFATTKVTDNVYIFRYGGHQSMFIVTPAGVIATDPISERRPAAKALHRGNSENHQGADQICGLQPQPLRSHRRGQALQGPGRHLHRSQERQGAHRRTEAGRCGHLPVSGGRFNKKVIKLGGTTLELFYVGKNHSDSTLVMRLPKEKIIFTVDWIPLQAIQFRGMADNFVSPDIEEGLKKKVIAMDWEKLIAGHPGPGGRQTGTKDDARNQLAYLQEVSAAVKKAVDEGKSYADAQKDIKLPKYEAWPNYNAFLPMNIERYYDFWNRGI